MFLLNTKNTPRWIVFVIDIIICFISIIAAYLLRFNFHIPQNVINGFYVVIPFVLAVRAISFTLGKTYASIVRYTGSKDAQRIAVVIIIGSVFFGLFNLVLYQFKQYYLIPYSIVI